VRGHQSERVDGTAAAGEDVHRPGAQRIDEPAQIVGLLLDQGLRGAVGALAAPRSAGIIGHDRPVGEMPGLSDESLGVHRRANQQQDRLGTGVIGPDVVVQHRYCTATGHPPGPGKTRDEPGTSTGCRPAMD
jgi:hypothetical protein